jgi:hypothetical protein
MSVHTDKNGIEKIGDQLGSETDLLSFHEQHAGRLVVDPEYVFGRSVGPPLSPNSFNREAKIEFGELFASKLKLTSDGTKVLWPQPTDDPEDPQNVRSLRLLHNQMCLCSVYSGVTAAKPYSS